MIISQMNTERAAGRVQLDLLDGESYQIRKIKKAASLKLQASSLTSAATKKGRNMTIKELEKEIREKITVLDKDELKKIIKYIDELCNDVVVEYNDTINHLKK